MEAVSHGALECLRILLDAGADPDCTNHIDEALMPKASEPRIIEFLLARGADPSDLETEVLRDYIGLGNAPDLPVTEKEYLDGRFRRFGTANPERRHRRTAETHHHKTPVYRLHIPSGVIERVTVTGPSPGWIPYHHAEHIDDRIVISGGKIVRQLDDSENKIADHTARYALDLGTGTWQQIG